MRVENTEVPVEFAEVAEADEREQHEKVEALAQVKARDLKQVLPVEPLGHRVLYLFELIAIGSQQKNSIEQPLRAFSSMIQHQIIKFITEF